MREIEIVCPVGIIQDIHYTHNAFSVYTQRISGSVRFATRALRNSEFFECENGDYYQTKPFTITVSEWEVEYVDPEKSPLKRSIHLVGKRSIENVLLVLDHFAIRKGETVLDLEYPYNFTGEIKDTELVTKGHSYED